MVRKKMEIPIDTSYTIEFYRKHNCIGYPAGTPLESMLWLQHAEKICIYRTRWFSSGQTIRTNLTWRIRQFQELWRRRHHLLRRAIYLLRRREQTGVNLQSYTQ